MNILVLTSVYPQDDDENNIGVTPVVQYFAKEWIKSGNNVIVIHNSNRYPKILYLLPDKIIKVINSKLGIVIPNKKQAKILYNEKDGIQSIRMPMIKFIPKTKYSERQVSKQIKEIVNFINKNNFKPDIIIGHWENPQIQIVAQLKKIFSAKTAIVFHSLVYITQNKYKNYFKKYIKEIDVIGARSNYIAKQVKEILEVEENPFICYSGINDKYFDLKTIDFSEKEKNSYLYVGRLISRKNVDVSIRALNTVYKDEKFKFKIVGNGAEEAKLLNIVKEFKIENKVELLGYKSRDEVINIMDEIETFIMISDNETFGLVYLEAMSRGCIVIASKNGGVDGIIKDGYNGFICEQGNKDELINICKNIRNMTIQEKKKISENAIETAFKFKDSEVARKYIENIIKEEYK